MGRALCAVLVMAVCFFGVTALGGQDVPKMTIEQLKARLDDPGVVVIDVRTPAAWKQSEDKIKGAIREDPMGVGSWMAKYPKDKTYVFYCT